MNEFEEALKEGMEAARIQESGEPEYRYIKGQGWQATYEPPYPTRVRNIGNYRVHFEQRIPLEGENFFVETVFDKRLVIDSLANALAGSAYWVDVFSRDLNYLKNNALPKWSPRDHDNHRVEHEAGRYALIVLTLTEL